MKAWRFAARRVDVALLVIVLMLSCCWIATAAKHPERFKDQARVLAVPDDYLALAPWINPQQQQAAGMPINLGALRQ
jgi:hypothetical protein